MFKLQIVLIPPKALDLQVPNYPVISTPNNSMIWQNNSNRRSRSPIFTSKQIKLSFNNNITNNNASAINYNCTSILNGNISTLSKFNTAMAANQKSLKQWRLKMNQIIAYRNQLFQKQCKKFLLFINLQSDLNQLADEILLKFKDMYPNFNEDLNIIAIQDNNGNDLDPDYIIKDVFNTNNIVNVLIDKDVDWNNPKYLETKYTRFSKRRKLNPNKYSNNNSNNNHIHSNNTIHVPMYMSRAPEVYRDIDSVIMDNTMSQTTSQSSSKVQSSSSISTPEVSRPKLKNIDDKNIDKDEKEIELYDQSSPRENLLGTPVMSIVTPSKLTNSQQKLYSNNNYLTETVRHHGSIEIETETVSNIILPLKTPTTKSNFSNSMSNGISFTTNGTSKTTTTSLDPSININTLSSNKKVKSTEMNNTTTSSRTIKYNSMNKEFKFERPSALSKAKIASLKRQQSTIANDRGSPMKSGQSSKDFSENVHLAELPTKPTNMLALRGKLLENNNGSKSIFEKIMEHQERINLTSTANNNITNVTIDKSQEKTTTQKPHKRQIINHKNYDSNKSEENRDPKSKDKKQESNNRLLNIDKNPNDKQQKSDNKDFSNVKLNSSGKYEDEVKDKSSLKDKSDSLPEDSKTKHTKNIMSNSSITATDTKIKPQSIGKSDTNPASKLQQEMNRDFMKPSNFLEHPKPNIRPNIYLNKPNDTLHPSSAKRKAKEISQTSQNSQTDQPKDDEIKRRNMSKSQKEHSQPFNNNKIIKENQITKTTTQTSQSTDISSNSKPINTEMISEEPQISSDKTPNIKYHSLSKLALNEPINQKEPIISSKTPNETPELQVTTRNKSCNKKANYEISSRNPSFKKAELLKMFETDDLKFPPWLSKNQKSTTQRVIGRSKPYLTVLNKDIDNSKPDPRNILPTRTPRNAARKASLKLSKQTAAFRSYDSDNSSNETEEIENYLEGEEEYESTSSSGIMTDVSSEEEVIANLANATQNIAVLRHDLKESIVSIDNPDTNNKTSTNSKQTQPQSNKNHDKSRISVCKTNTTNKDNKLVLVSSRNENMLNETKNSFSNKQNNDIKKTGIKQTKTINNIDSKLYQSPSYLKLSQSNESKIPNTIILSNDSDEPNSPERFTKYFPNKPVSKYNNQAVTKPVSNKEDNDVKTSTFMDYLKHPEVGEDLLLNLDSSDSDDDNDKISIISSSSSIVSVKEIRQVQSSLKSSEDINTFDEKMHNLPSPHNSSRSTSILHSIHSKSVSIGNNSSLEFVTNTSTNISNRLERLKNFNLAGTRTTSSLEVTPLAYGIQNNVMEEGLTETSSEYETSSVELYE